MSELIAETSTPAVTATSEPPKELSQLEQIENLLAGKKNPEKEPPQPEAGREPETGQQQAKEPTTEPEKAETVEDDPSIDYAKEVPLANGEKLSIGALKDFYQGFAQKELALIERENQVLSQHNELQEMAQYLQLPPEAKQRIQQQQQEYMQEQHGLMLKAMPEWADKATFERARGQIFELAKEYGVDVSQVSDHKVVKMLNDFARLRAAIKTAKANVKQVKPADPKAPVLAPKNGNSDLQQAMDTAKRTGNIADQVKAVDYLLNG